MQNALNLWNPVYLMAKWTKTITQKVIATKRHICYKENRFHKKEEKKLFHKTTFINKKKM